LISYIKENVKAGDKEDKKIPKELKEKITSLFTQNIDSQIK
jgi:hypothetical protein